MSNPTKNESWHRKLIISVGILIAIYVLIFMDAAEHGVMLKREISNIENVISLDATKVVVFRAKNWYDITMIKSGVSGFIDQFNQDTGLNGESLWRNPLTRIISNVKSLWYQTLIRISLMLFWFWMSIGIIAAAVVDGLMLRKIRQHEFTSPSTGYFRVAMWSSTLVVLVLELYCIIPAYFATPIFPLFPLISAVLIAVLVKVTLSNSAKDM